VALMVPTVVEREASSLVSLSNVRETTMLRMVPVGVRAGRRRVGRGPAGGTLERRMAGYWMERTAHDRPHSPAQ
jgi:hypothetical protein